MKFSKLFCKFAIILSIILSFRANAQMGLGFLNLPSNALQNALGGENITSGNKYILQIIQNPALLDSSKLNNLGISYSPYFANTHILGMAYAFANKQKNHLFSIHAQHLNLGSFDGTDAIGNSTAKFGAGDFILSASTSHKINNITFGLSVKALSSYIESSYLMAGLVDFGGTFKHPKKDLVFGIVAKNLGLIMAKNSIDAISLPFNLQMGVSFKPKFMPIRVSITANNLQKPDILSDVIARYGYDNNGNKVKEKISFSQKIFSHCIFGTEILFHSNIHGLLGFDFFQKKTMQLANLPNKSGFSYGIDFSFKKLGFVISQKSMFSGKKLTMFSLNWKI